MYTCIHTCLLVDFNSKLSRVYTNRKKNPFLEKNKRTDRKIFIFPSVFAVRVNAALGTCPVEFQTYVPSLATSFRPIHMYR
jgi:hypothetical protein